MRKESFDFLTSLLNTASPGGHESRIQELWCAYTAGFADEVRTDSYGNAIAAVNPGGSPRILLDGHCDEIALIVKHVDDSGFIYVQQMGGIDVGQLRGKRVHVHTQAGPVLGVIGAEPPWVKEKLNEDGGNKKPKIHECWVDIGAGGGRDVRRRVSVGDPVTFVEDFRMLNAHVGVARAHDDRIGAWTAAEALRLVARGRPACAVYATSTVQEETGCHGAKMIVHDLRPDVALELEVTHATDTPGMNPRMLGSVKLGKGPVVYVGRENHPVVVKRLRDLARKRNIPVQAQTFSLVGGTNALSIWIANGGVPSAVIGVPDRYMHSTVEMIDLRDAEAAARLAAAFCADVKAGETFKIPIRIPRGRRARPGTKSGIRAGSAGTDSQPNGVPPWPPRHPTTKSR